MPLRSVRHEHPILCRFRFRTLALAGLLAAAGLLGAARIAEASEVPSSAFAQGLSVAPDFFDHASLIFQHPQRAVGLPRQVMVWNTGAGPEASGGVWRVDRQRLFLLSQSRVPVVHAGDFSAGIPSFSTLRGGWAFPLGSWRLGLSASGGLDKDSSIEEGLFYDQSTHRYAYQYDVLEETVRTGDVLLGCGRGEGRSSFDLTLETRWEKRDEGLIRAQQTNTSTDTLVVSFEGDERPRPGAHLRVRAPLSSRLDCVVLGDWTGYEERRPGRFQGVLFGTQVDSSRVESAYADSWRAAVGFGRPIEPLDFVFLSATYRSSRLPQFSPESYGPARAYTTDRSFDLTTSVREEVRSGLYVHAGVERRYHLRKRTAETIGSSGNAYVFERDRDDEMTSAFHWGADWKWRNLRLTAVLSPTLRLDNLFSTLDAQLTF